MSLRHLSHLSIFALSALARVAIGSGAASAQPVFDAAKYGFEWQSGLRYWTSIGKHQLSLKDTSGTAQVSRLTWDHVTGHAAETFFRADHWSGLFLKGQLGAGSLTSGKLKDEDFPPFIAPSSSTDSRQRAGSLSYWNADIGYTISKGPQARFGGFAGYSRWNETLRAFGCTQTNANASVCVPAINGHVLGITEDYQWSAWRLGLTGDLKLSDRLTLTGEAAFLVGATLDGGDRHHLRPISLPHRTPVDGDGHGVQLEAMLTYALNEAFSMGVGARYWHVDQAKGQANFTVNGGLPQATTVESERYGLFVQASYKLGAKPVGGSTKDAAAPTAPYNWNGPYAGLHIGTGSGDDKTSISGDPVVFANVVQLGNSPTVLNSPIQGMLGGFQIGYNWRIGAGLIGVEADISVASLVGAGTFESVNGPFNTTIERKIDALGSLRARAGYLLSPSTLLYLTGGLAVGHTSLKYSTTNLGTCTLSPGCESVSSSGLSAGWTAGFGYEYAFTSNMTWKTEYAYTDLGSRSATIVVPVAPAGNFRHAQSDFNIQTVRTGVNFKF
jgi:opacity protein-like surface antigen